MRGRFGSSVLLAAALAGGLAQGAQTATVEVRDWAAPGFRVGESDLVIGGFVTFEVDDIEGEPTAAELDATLLALYQPTDALHLFAELELGPLVSWDDVDGTETDLHVAIERIHLDLAMADAFGVRVGKFLTPFGRWNQAQAEPLRWTTSEPLLVEQTFDDTVSGAMLHGSRFPAGGELSYAVYGTLYDPIETDTDEVGSEDSLGARLEWASLGDWTVGASYFASEIVGDGWGALGGLDLRWQATERVELSLEALAGRGSFVAGRVSGAFLQGVFELRPALYAVARVERFEPATGERAATTADLGVVWQPRPRLRLKADYLFGDDPDEIAERGVWLSFSALF